MKKVKSLPGMFVGDVGTFGDYPPRDNFRLRRYVTGEIVTLVEGRNAGYAVIKCGDAKCLASHPQNPNHIICCG